MTPHISETNHVLKISLTIALDEMAYNLQHICGEGNQLLPIPSISIWVHLIPRLHHNI